MEQLSTTCPRRLCACASERVKLISTLDGRYPDLGHHLENEMGGLWMQPIKLLDGFWMHFRDLEDTADCWLAADGYTAHPYGNTFHYRQGMGHTGMEIDLHQLAPEGASGLILRYELNNCSRTGRRIALAFLVRTDLRPAWSAVSQGAPDSGQDVAASISEQGTFHATTEGRPWHVMVGSDTRPDRTETGQLWGPELTGGKGVSCRMEFELSLAAGEVRSLYFFVAGSMSSKEDCALQYRTLATETQRLWEEKVRRMEQVASRAELVVEDEGFANRYNWVKYNTDWLAMETPAGRGIAAGLPEYAWWFGCDSCYTVQGLLCMGDIALARDTLRLLLGISREQCGDGRIVHEIVGDGSVYHYGNVQETAHFIDTLWRYYQWTRDEELLWEALPYLDKSVKWLLDQDDDNDLFPTGYGIVEISGMNLELIDSAVYTAKAFEAYAKICRTLGMGQERGIDFGTLAERLADKINQEFWDEQEGLYCDVVAGTKEVQEKLESILRTVPKARREQARECLEQKIREREREPEKGWLLNENWVINTPMEMELAPRRQADRALKRMHTPEFIGEYGMFLSGMSQREIMTISTGVMAAAQVRYGYPDRALELLYRMGDTFGRATPGAISEMSPDYGCFVQAWTAYAMFVPVVTGFFGVHPKGEAGEIQLCPCMPKAWKQAQLHRLPILNGELSLSYRKEEGAVKLEIHNRTDYPIRLVLGEERLLEPGTHQIQWKEEEKVYHDPL